MNITAPLSRVQTTLIRRTLWLIWYPLLLVNLTIDHGRSKNYKKIVWVTWYLGWQGIKA